jgi:lysozyme
MSCDPRTYPFIGHHEGKVLKAYRCPANVVTIGYGCTMGSRVFAAFAMKKWGRALRLGDAITADEAMGLLKNCVDGEYLPPVEQRAPGASPNAKSAAASVSFNCGPGSLTWKWFAALKAGRVMEAAARLRSAAVTAKGRRLPGLVRRRAEEADILENNAWPKWLRAVTIPVSAPASPGAIEMQMPVEPLQSDDAAQGKQWLAELGYLRIGIGNSPRDVTPAVKRFQADHAQLTVDGIMGRATLDQLQRSVDLKTRLKQSAAAGAVTSTAGSGDQMGGISGYGDFIIYGGAAVFVIGACWFAWRYRDELKIALMPRKAA